ncbi:ATP phosphoribosyltransferase regulatory subunit [Oceaniglobus ichthyenteri]|uniref:ATP phosphoribosyltransferase regulatory subunit n=1 Tax=Oceaniglobus ichthyenteri TaxID=2136177 RepID=UPI000D3C9E67|nr:ATP phosphoribosyltransferase regulatory subunit [Oceaniglobus ichthyenteri]
MVQSPTEKPAILAEAARLRALFEAAGAQPVEAPILQPADLLLDLYGEDIRARAFTTSDPLHGEQMLRPDFTVPVVQMHMAGGADPARYTYSGEVFRRQEDDPERAREYIQVGFEVFDGANPARADAEVFAVIARALADVPLRAAVGDIGILIAAINALSTSARRKAALLRHLWRPNRFRALLDRFGAAEPTARRAKLLALDDPFEGAGPEIGLRSRAEVEARLAILRDDANAPPIPAVQVELLDDLMALRAPAPAALSRLQDVAVDMPAIVPAVDLFEARLAALSDQGVDLRSLEFEGSYGRTTMEYYDGFVFGFYAEGRHDLPPVASGGRYDALTRVLGQGRAIPAVGGVIRPDLVLMLGAGT